MIVMGVFEFWLVRIPVILARVIREAVTSSPMVRSFFVAEPDNSEA